MKRFLGIEQKKTQRKTKEWIDNLSVEDAKRMNIKKDSFDGLKDKKLYLINNFLGRNFNIYFINQKNF